jgi:hypothetical protein
LISSVISYANAGQWPLSASPEEKISYASARHPRGRAVEK